MIVFAFVRILLQTSLECGREILFDLETGLKVSLIDSFIHHFKEDAEIASTKKRKSYQQWDVRLCGSGKSVLNLILLEPKKQIFVNKERFWCSQKITFEW